MFYTSNEEKKNFYKVSQVSRGTTSKGDRYTFISISNKKQNTNDYENAKLMYWNDAENVEKGDFVAFYNILGCEQYSFTPTGSLKNYTGVNISTSNIEIKKAEQKEEQKTEQNKDVSLQNNSSDTSTSNFQPISDDSLPF